MGIELISAAEADRPALSAFLERAYGPVKAAFLDRHGAWWHGGDENRRVLTVDGVVAGYCAVLPARVRLAGRPRDAVWWIDLVIAPEFRGRGLQTHFDREIRERSELLLGFPNALAARIHACHGWGVREDLRVMLLPLVPPRLPAVMRPGGTRGVALATAARLVAPVAAGVRRRFARLDPGTARQLEAPDPDELSAIADCLPADFVTTDRTTAHLTRRYLDAPDHDTLRFYTAGSVALVVRRLVRGGQLVERWLDLFGDLDDRRHLGDLLRLARREAVRAGVVQITALATHPRLVTALRRAGFWMSTRTRFCWWSAERATMEALDGAPIFWVLGDSDHDEPA